MAMATKTLILLRHAKAEHGSAMMQDFDRPLAASGREEAAACAAWLKPLGFDPFVLYSPAMRTTQTLECLDVTAPQQANPSLYLASAGDLLHEIQQMDAQEGCGDVLLLLGHNPGLHELLRFLMGSGAAALREQVEWDFPTCACAVLRFDADSWAALQPQSGELIHARAGA
jgi:phosphohistidine phosphatase